MWTSGMKVVAPGRKRWWRWDSFPAVHPEYSTDSWLLHQSLFGLTENKSRARENVTLNSVWGSPEHAFLRTGVVGAQWAERPAAGPSLWDEGPLLWASWAAGCPIHRLKLS